MDERDMKRQEAILRKEKISNLCKRCRSLRFQNEAIVEEKVYQDGATLLAPHVHNFDRKELLRTMLPKIYPRSIIVYVCDVANFEASIVPEIFDKIIREHHRVIIVVNKLDALPKGFKIDSVQAWVKRQMMKHIGDDLNQVE